MIHRFQSAKSNGADGTLVQPSNWNDLHNLGVKALSANTTLDSTYDFVPVTTGASAITITLPTAVSADGLTYTITKVDSGAGAVTVATTSSQTINGSTTYLLNVQYDSVTLVAQNGNWLIQEFVSKDSRSSFFTSTTTLTANTYADATTLALPPGVWVVFAAALVKSPSATAQRVTAKLWDGSSVVYAACENAAPSQGSSTAGYLTCDVQAIVTVTSATTLHLAIASTAASIIENTPGDNATGIGNTSTYIVAHRIA